MRNAWLPVLVCLMCAVAPSPRALAGPPGEQPPLEITLLAVGDLMLARSIGRALAQDPPDSPFAAVAPLLRGADVTVGNLECALGTGGRRARKSYTFRGPPVAAASLADAGFDLVSLANNHSLDYGAPALDETLRALDAAGVRFAGAGPNEIEAYRPAILDVHGLRLAFLAYVDTPAEGSYSAGAWRARGDRAGVAWADPDRIAAGVTAARQAADLVVVLLHSGREGSSTPDRAQRRAARAAIDAGAALVIGAHPHVLQGLERYNGGVIAYSLGNFVFDGFGNRQESAILRVTLGRDGVRAVAWAPVVLRAGRPVLADEQQAKAIRQRLDQLSDPLW